ncbi:sensor histidine kinase [Paenibacillus sp. HW567]|uniref:sensor histidine kinase n=1 Tax=Paenibacillus sp. HW567 TaxID=1034769 RepID=UPI0003745A24|nr:sensor histidine kinase [Paenibacillus sp. HW567]
MVFIEEKIYKSLARVVGTLFLIIAYYHEFAGQHKISFMAGFFVLLLYIVLIWADSNWWNETKYFLISMLIIIVSLCLHFVYGSIHSSLLWPLFIIISMIRKEYGRVSITIGLITLIAILITYSFSWNTLLALLGLFLIIRSLKIRRQAHQLTKIHLEELDQAHKELKAAHAELQEASVHSVRYAALEERTRLSREIHDGLGHQLTSLIVQLQALEIIQVAQPDKAAELIKQTIEIARQAMAEVRIAVKEWADDEMGLGLVALKGLASQIEARAAIKINFKQESNITEWPIQTSIVLYRVLQEALTNILRHARATTALVSIKEINEKIYLTISDNGQYTGQTPLTSGYGLKGIVDRCKEYGGHCSFSLIEPHGFCIEAVIPIEKQADC